MKERTLIHRCMLCGNLLNKKIVTERLSDHKKIVSYNIGMFKHLDDGSVVAICKVCYRALYGKRGKIENIPYGWIKIGSKYRRRANKKARLELIYETLKRNMEKVK